MSTLKNNSSDFFLRSLISLMESRGISKAQLARDVGVSNAHVANWLKGQIPNADNLLAISRHFGLTVEKMLCGEDPKPSGPGGVGNAPMYNPGLGAKARFERTVMLEKEAKEFREMAAKLRTDADELIVRAVTYEDWAASILEDDDDEEDWD